jgi:hypothetical protein
VVTTLEKTATPNLRNTILSLATLQLSPRQILELLSHRSFVILDTNVGEFAVIKDRTTGLEELI